MKLIILISCLCLTSGVQADYVNEHLPLCCFALLTPALAAPQEINAPNPKRTRLLISSLTLGVVLYGATNWWEDSSSEFRVRNEG